MQAKKLVNSRGLTYVTSSLEKKELLSLTERSHSDQASMISTQESGEKLETEDSKHGGSGHGGIGYFINASAAYDIAASAAAYLHSQTKSILPFSSTNVSVKHSENGSIDDEVTKSSVKAVTKTVTSVISSEEDVKQSVADDLNSIVSSPCEWFICDDKLNGTRYFIIQVHKMLSQCHVFIAYACRLEKTSLTMSGVRITCVMASKFTLRASSV